MKKYILQIASFAFVLFLLVSCSSDSAKDATDEIKMDYKLDQKYEYNNIDGVYVLTKMYDNTTGSITDADGKVEDDSSIDSTDLPNEEIGEYNNFEIADINETQVVLINNSYSKESSYNTKDSWKFICEITNGTLEDFNNGETIEVKTIDDKDYDRAQETAVKVIMVKTIPSADPYQTSVKVNSRNHVFLVSKYKIIETLNSNLTSSIKVLKEVKE
jgi:hypothetical protein